MYEAFKRAITYVCNSSSLSLYAFLGTKPSLFIYSEPEEVMGHCSDLDTATKDLLISVINRRLTSQPIKIRAGNIMSISAVRHFDRY